MECPKNICKIISATGLIDRIFCRQIKINLLSSEGKVLSILIANKSCIIKEISGLTGVSQRAVYNCLKKFEGMGILKRETNHHDRRFHVVSIDPQAFCESFCNHIPDDAQGLQPASRNAA